MPENNHDRLRELLQDRNKPKQGRISVPMHIVLDAQLAFDLNTAELQLNAAKEAAKQATPAQPAEGGDRRVGGRPTVDADLESRVAEAQKAFDAAEEAAAEATVAVVFSALKADDYDELEKLHPPREDDKEDLAEGHNRDTFPTALMYASATKVIDRDKQLVDMDTEELLRSLSAGERLMGENIAMQVNIRTTAVPFSVAGSSSRPRSGGRSKRR